MTSRVPYAEVIGDPVEHSKSPLIHGFWLEKLGIEGEYRACHLPPDGLQDYLVQRRGDPAWRGCNVTMPLKLMAAGLLDAHRSPGDAREPVNLILPEDGRLYGTNTDVVGILEPLRALDRRPFGGADGPRLATVLGAGGVLLSVARVLRSLGYRPVTYVARSRDKVRALLGAEGGDWRFVPWGEPLPPTDLLVNATPLGMAGQPPLPYDAGSVNEGGTVFEMIYAPLVTPLVADARARRLRRVDGLQMLVAQAAPSFERLFGRAPPREHDDDLRRLLTA